MAPALEYMQWRNFQNVLKRAMIACENSGHHVEYDFAEVSKIVEAGISSNRNVDFSNRSNCVMCYVFGYGILLCKMEIRAKRLLRWYRRILPFKHIDKRCISLCEAENNPLCENIKRL